jgi:hypothetical protein
MYIIIFINHFHHLTPFIPFRVIVSSCRYPVRHAEVKEALFRATGEFLKALGGAPEGKSVFCDYLELIALLGDPWGEE